MSFSVCLLAKYLLFSPGSRVSYYGYMQQDNFNHLLKHRLQYHLYAAGGSVSQ